MIRIETLRLILREMTPADAPALLPIVGDPKNMRFYARAFTPEEIASSIERQMERYRSGTGLLGMVLKENGTLVGDCGPVWQEVDGRQELEIGYHVHPAWQNLGLATEASRAVREYAFTSLGVEGVISMIRPENLPSRRVAENNGLRLDRIVFWRGFDHCIYRAAKA